MRPDDASARPRTGKPMPALQCLSLLASLGLAGCTDLAERRPSGDATVSRSLAASSARVDPVAARDLISIYRRNNGLGTISVDPALQRAAEAQAQAMAAADSASHDVRGSLKSRLAEAGVAPAVAVENVSAGYHTLADAFSGWRGSKPHNANMLNPAVRRIGIATAYAPGTKYKVFWALVLAN